MYTIREYEIEEHEKAVAEKLKEVTKDPEYEYNSGYHAKA